MTASSATTNEVAQSDAATASEIIYLLLSRPSEVAAVNANAAALAPRLTDARGADTVVVAAAIWALRDAGRIELEIRKGKSLGFIPKTELIATLRDANGAAGVEGDLLAKLAKKSSRSVEDVVRDWFGAQARDVARSVLNRFSRAGVASGLLVVVSEEQERGRISGAIFGKTKTVESLNLNAERAGSLGARLAEAPAAWLRFRQSEAELAEELLKRVAAALRDREDDDDDGPDFD